MASRLYGNSIKLVGPFLKELLPLLAKIISSKRWYAKLILHWEFIKTVHALWSPYTGIYIVDSYIITGGPGGSMS